MIANLAKWFLLPDGSKRRPKISHYADTGHGHNVGVSWEGVDLPHVLVQAGLHPQETINDLAELIADMPAILINARDAQDSLKAQIECFQGKTWRGEAVAIEDDSPRGGIWVHGAGILSQPVVNWSRHFAFWFASWKDLADTYAMVPCGVGVHDGVPYVKLTQWEKPRKGDQ